MCAFQTPTLCRVFYEKEEVFHIMEPGFLLSQKDIRQIQPLNCVNPVVLCGDESNMIIVILFVMLATSMLGNVTGLEIMNILHCSPFP